MALAEAGAAAFGPRAELKPDRGVAQLVRLRVAQLNHCTYSRSRPLRYSLPEAHTYAGELPLPQQRPDIQHTCWNRYVCG
jgi:hypothetical protein